MAWRFDGRAGLFYKKIYLKLAVCTNVTRDGSLVELLVSYETSILLNLSCDRPHGHPYYGSRRLSE